MYTELENCGFDLTRKSIFRCKSKLLFSYLSTAEIWGWEFDQVVIQNVSEKARSLTRGRNVEASD